MNQLSVGHVWTVEGAHNRRGVAQDLLNFGFSAVEELLPAIDPFLRSGIYLVLYIDVDSINREMPGLSGDGPT